MAYILYYYYFYAFLSVFSVTEWTSRDAHKAEKRRIKRGLGCNHLFFLRATLEIIKEWGPSEQLRELWSGEEELMSCRCHVQREEH